MLTLFVAVALALISLAGGNRDHLPSREPDRTASASVGRDTVFDYGEALPPCRRR